MKNDKFKGMLAAGLSYSIFGLSYLFSTVGMDAGGDPEILLCTRFAVTFLVLNLMLLFRMGKLDLKGKKLLPPLALGALQPVLYYFLENYGSAFSASIICSRNLRIHWWL